MDNNKKIVYVRVTTEEQNNKSYNTEVPTQEYAIIYPLHPISKRMNKNAYLSDENFKDSELD